MKKVNYKSDFDFILKLVDCQGRNIGWPTYDWTLELWTSFRDKEYTVMCRSGNGFNCYRDNDNIIVIMDDHNLSCGVLQGELTVLLEDSIYPDRYKKIVVPVVGEIELVKEAVTCLPPLSLEIVVPHELDNGISNETTICMPLNHTEIDAAIEAAVRS